MLSLAKQAEARRRKGALPSRLASSRTPSDGSKTLGGSKALGAHRAIDNLRQLSGAAGAAGARVGGGGRGQRGVGSVLVSRNKRWTEDDATGGRFRLINEILYSSRSDEAWRKIKEEKVLDLAATYHEGYAQQMAKWPEHPLDRIIKYLRETIKGGEIVLDLGAGSCRLSQALSTSASVSGSRKQTGEGGAVVISVDFAPPPTVLQSQAKWKSGLEYLAKGGFIHSSLRSIPLLPDNCADFAVFSLSLMGSDWPHFVAEAVRVLKPRGQLIIAEVASRARKPDLLLKTLEKQKLKLVKKDQLDNYFFIWYFRLFKQTGASALVSCDQGASGQAAQKKKVNEKADLSPAAWKFDPEAVNPSLLTPCVYKKINHKLPKLRSSPKDQSSASARGMDKSSNRSQRTGAQPQDKDVKKGGKRQHKPARPDRSLASRKRDS